MFWDVCAQRLEVQALEPIKSFDEMQGHAFRETEILDVVVSRLSAIPAYRRLFEAAYDRNNAASAANLGKAIAAFERTLVTNNSHYDQHMRGSQDAISLAAKDSFA